MTGKQQLVFYDVCDRYEYMIESSLTLLNSHQYLGFTDGMFKPFKFFKLNNINQEIWIGPCNSPNSEIMRILSYDKKDDLVIETVLL